MYLRIIIRDGEAVFDAYEHVEDDMVVGYVTPSGEPIDMASFHSPTISYLSREELAALPA